MAPRWDRPRESGPVDSCQPESRYLRLSRGSNELEHDEDQVMKSKITGFGQVILTGNCLPRLFTAMVLDAKSADR
jgi:hypothetical protein